MAYTIIRSDGSVLTTIQDGTIDTTHSSLGLPGRNYAGYGQFLDTNFIHLLENSSDTTPPGAPLVGQLWWDSGNALLKVYNGTVFKTISAATAATLAPSGSTSVMGDLWFDTSNGNKVYYFNSSTNQWVVTDDTRISATAAGLVTEQTARTTADSALSSQITTLTSTVNGHSIRVTKSGV